MRLACVELHGGIVIGMRDVRQLNELRRFIRAVLSENFQDPVHDFNVEKFKTDPLGELKRFLDGMDVEYRDLEKTEGEFPKRRVELIGNLKKKISGNDEVSVEARKILLGDGPVVGLDKWVTHGNLEAAKERFKKKITALQSSIETRQSLKKSDQPRKGTDPGIVGRTEELSTYDEILGNLNGLLYIMRPRGFSYESNVRREILKSLKTINGNFGQIPKDKKFSATEKIELAKRFNALLKKIKDNFDKYKDPESGKKESEKEEKVKDKDWDQATDAEINAEIAGQITALNTKLANLRSN